MSPDADGVSRSYLELADVDTHTHGILLMARCAARAIGVVETHAIVDAVVVLGVVGAEESVVLVGEVGSSVAVACLVATRPSHFPVGRTDVHAVHPHGWSVVGVVALVVKEEGIRVGCPVVVDHLQRDVGMTGTGLLNDAAVLGEIGPVVGSCLAKADEEKRQTH